MDKEKNRRKLSVGIAALIIFTIIAGWLGLPDVFRGKIISMIVLGPILGIAFSAVIANYVEYITGNILKEEYLVIRNIGGYDFSISVFFLVTFILELILF